MKNSFRTLAALCSLAVAFVSGCADGAPESSGNSTTPLMNENPSGDGESIPDVSDEEDINPVPAQSADNSVVFGSDGVKISGTGLSADGAVVTITEAGLYGVSGSGEGKIIIDAGKSDEVTLVLDGIALSSPEGSAVVCESAAKLILTTAPQSENTLSDSENYSFADGETEPDAAVYSKSDMDINGSGVLCVNGLYKDGIRCKDGLRIYGSQIRVSAAEDGVIGKDYLVFYDGTLEVTSGGDGIKSTNSDDDSLGYIRVKGGQIGVTSGCDAVQAETELIIEDGSIKAQSGGGSETVEHTADDRNDARPFDFDGISDEEESTAESMKGLKAGTALRISGGSIEINAHDDSLHSNGTITIDGGDFRLSSGDDGIHADDSLTVNDGSIYISECNEGLEGSCIEINGGAIELNAFDDGINAGGGSDFTADYIDPFAGDGDVTPDHYINITGGSITINAEGDGLDSNGAMALSGGTLVVFGPTGSGNGALDYESSFAVSGGTLIALGFSGMAQAPSTLSQPCLSIFADAAAGRSIEVRDSEGNVVLGVDTPKDCRSLIFSTDKFVVGEKYGIYANEELLEEVTAGDGVSGSGASGAGGFGGFGGSGADRRKPDGGFPGGAAPEGGFRGGQDKPGDFDPAKWGSDDFEGTGASEGAR